jgi:hypothetical protein
LILELFGEIESRKIISCLLENEYTIPQILKESKVPKTSGYRKIENLILNGLLIESGKILSESKKISKLRCVLQEIKLDIKKGKIEITGVISKKMFEKSSSMKKIGKNHLTSSKSAFACLKCTSSIIFPSTVVAPFPFFVEFR